MAPSDVQRKLTAILCTDVVGYSRLMGDDHEGTLAALSESRIVFSRKIEEYHGRVVNSPGDSILAEFGSVVDAVSCAVDIQRELAERNHDLPENRRMDFRIGINLGDVLVQDGDLYGDGVNIAARLESLAEPGGICISGNVFDQVESRLPLHFEFKGEKAVKNIAKPVRTYQVLTKPGDAAHRVVKARKATSQPNYPDLPDKPSIAVLPFENMSGDPDQEYFVDGLTEDIITDLSVLPGLFVIARSSTFTYKGKAVTTQQVGREMGVRYVLEGSVRKSGGRVRITTQLIEAATGHHLWAKRYDRLLEDVFTVQDELTEEIVTTLDVKLAQGESGRYYRRGLKNPEAREAFYRGRAHHDRMTPQDMEEARKYFEQVMQLEPDSPLGYANACYYYSLDYLLHWFGGEGDSVKKLHELVKKALALDENDPTALSMLGRYHLFMREHDLAIEASEKATLLGPSLTLVWRNLGWIQMWNETPRAAIKTLRSAMRFSPTFHPITASQLGSALRNDGQMEDAESILKSALGTAPTYNAPRAILATIYGVQERDEEARNEVRELLRVDPEYTVTKYATPNLYRNPDYIEQWLEPLRKAGLPE